MKFWLRVGLGITVLALGLIFITTFSTVLPDAATTMGQLRYFVLISGFVLALVGISLLRQSDKLDWPFIACISGILIYLVSFHATLDAANLVQEVVLPRLFGLLLTSSGIFSIIMKRSEELHLEALKVAYRHLSSNAGILIIIAAILASIFDPIMRGVILIYTVFCGIGIGIAVWMFAPKTRLPVVLAFSPVIGFSLIAVVGSWLVNADLPVQKWAWIVTLSLLFLSLGLLLWWGVKHPDRWVEINWRSVIQNLGLGYAAALAVMIPVVIGGLRFSVFRGNPADDQNYVSMAAFLLQVPYSRYQDVNFLFSKNPAIYWGSFFLQTRWATSMLMAYTTQITSMPLYRFDFAFSAFPFTMILAPVFVKFRETQIGHRWALLLSTGICLGYYAQVILDSRAVALCTALPVLIALVLQADRIWTDEGIYLGGRLVYPGEAILFLLLTIALVVLYTEILAILIPGFLLSGIYFAVRKDFHLKGALTLLATGILALVLISASLPLYIRFFLNQVSGSQNLFVDWQDHYFLWLYHDFPVGVFGLNPYQLVPMLSTILNFFTALLLVLVIFSLPLLLLRSRGLENIFYSSACFVIGGSSIFLYLYLRGQLWQAGKILTYIYPFFMILIAIVPFVLTRQRIHKWVQAVARNLVLLWLVSQAALGLYRLVVVVYGYEYPFYVRDTGHTTQTYYTQYSWNINPFLVRLRGKDNPQIWLSTNYLFQDMLWAIALPSNTQVFNVNPFVGFGMDTHNMTLANITSRLPDYLLIDNSIWDLNQNAGQIKPDLRDSSFSLIEITNSLPSTPLLIGLRNDPFSLSDNPKRSISLDKEVWMEFFSSAKCKGQLSGRVTLDPHQNAKVDIMIVSQPGGWENQVSINPSNELDITFPLSAGYNLVTLQLLAINAALQPAVEISAPKFSYLMCEPQ